jgi:hypothetical protein
VVYDQEWLQEWIAKRHIFERNMCSKYENHYRLNSHNRKGGMDLYDHYMSTRIFTLKNRIGVHMSSENYNESG